MNGGLGVTLSLLASVLTLAAGIPQAQQPDPPAGGSVPNEIIIKFRPSVSDLQRNRIIADRGGARLRRFRTLDAEHVRLPTGLSVATTIAALQREPAVELVQPNFIRRIVGTAPPNDPYWVGGNLWGVERIQAQSVWNSFTTGASTVVIANLDTGVNYQHRDLSGNMWKNPREKAGNGRDDDGNGYVDDVFGIDTINHDSNPMDDQGHGTHTAGTIAATGNNSRGVVGVAWGSRILACKFINASGFGTDAAAIECFNYIIDLKRAGIDIRVSSNSWGAPREGAPATILQAAIDEAGAIGIINIFAAGNDGTDNDTRPFDPANFSSDSIVSVAASNEIDGRAGFSNYGASSVDLAAPGNNILSTYGTGYAYLSGTSMATPHVAGAAALLVSKVSALSVDAVKYLLLQTADPLPEWSGVVASGGRLNVFSAATAAGGNLPPSVTITSPAASSTVPVSTTVSLEARTGDIDGVVTQVAFYAKGIHVGTDATGAAGVFSVNWTPTLAGPYALTAIATDDDGANRTSAAVNVYVDPPPGRVNVARAANGGVAMGSTTQSGYPASAVNNGDRKGENWNNGGGWIDGTWQTWPDWLEVQFSGSHQIEQVDIFTVQDNYNAPTEPTFEMRFSGYGLRDFVVQYWTGNEWTPIPDGTVTDNSNVWRQFNFAPITTSRIRVWVTRGEEGSSRLTEVEAYAVFGTVNVSPQVTLTKPSTGTSVAVGTVLNLEAMASDSDGTVTQVDFRANDVVVGTVTGGVGGVYGTTWTPTLSGTYALTAVATDDRGATRTSDAATVTIDPPPGRVNVALAANGGVTTASTTQGGYPASAVNNGDRKGENWNNGGGWIDGTWETWPDWLEVQFSGAHQIEQVDVFTVQDNYNAPSEPTLAMTFTSYGVRDFVMEYWTGSAWAPISDAAVTGNNRIWRQFTFAPITTSRIRVWITRGEGGSSRLTEVEAYAVFGSVNVSPQVTLTKPAAGTTVAVGTTVSLEATASDSDGTVTQVDFYAKNAHVGAATAPTGGVYSVNWTPSVSGTYSLTAVATDDRGATRTSSPVSVTITPPPGRVNVALAENGAVAVGSTTQSGYPASAVNNGDRKGENWNNGGGWIDGTWQTWPDWLEVQFSDAHQIEQIDVFTVQDTYNAPSEPTLTMTFNSYGVRDFVLEYWTGSGWAAIPDGGVTNNTNVWRQFTFAPITTSRIRVWITRGEGGSSRLTEVEAYAVLGTVNVSPQVALTKPAPGTTVAPGTPLGLEASASDSDGIVTKVDFYANAAAVGTATTATGGVYGVNWTPTLSGTYALTAVATDDRGATRTSDPVSVTISSPPGRVNVALTSNGGVAVGSTTQSGYPASAVINGDRKGAEWNSGGGWIDGTWQTWPDWLEVQFSGTHQIEQVDVITVQDNYNAPSEPTLDMTFTQYGLRDFVVEYWTGTAWAPIPDAAVTNNNKVWRQFTFAPISTSRIRVWVTRGEYGSSRIAEIEAYAR